MMDELVGKLTNLLAGPLDESRVQHSFTLSRKLIERVPAPRRGEFALLKFYCDWTVHSDIDRSSVGAKVLTRIHGVVADHLKKADNSSFATDLTSALSLEETRVQLNKLVNEMGGPDDAATKDKWRELVPVMAEIISNCPLTISPRYPRLATFLAAIRARPLKGTSVVEQLTVIKILTSVFNPAAPADEITYCVMLTTTDTTKIVTPLVYL